MKQIIEKQKDAAVKWNESGFASVQLSGNMVFTFPVHRLCLEVEAREMEHSIR